MVPWNQKTSARTVAILTLVGRSTTSLWPRMPLGASQRARRGGKEPADFDRLGIVLDLEACLALFDVLRVVVTQAAAEGRL